eukprot:15464817-Alexandrium_andersonii.AAC.1
MQPFQTVSGRISGSDVPDNLARDCPKCSLELGIVLKQLYACPNICPTALCLSCCAFAAPLSCTEVAAAAAVAADPVALPHDSSHVQSGQPYFFTQPTQPTEPSVPAGALLPASP